MRRVLVTGVTGFAGSHLVDYMLTRGDCEIFGIQRWRSRTENIEHFADKITLLECDLRDATSTRDTLEKVRPDWIFHLAAQSFVPTSWIAPTESLTTNVARRRSTSSRRCASCGSSAASSSPARARSTAWCYPDEVPIKETNPLRPLSPYAVSKVAQDLLGYQYWMSWKVDSVRTRGFNHEGPRRGPVFVASDFAKQIADIEKGRKPPVLQRRQPRREARLHRRARHGARLLAGAREVRAGRGLQHLQRHARGPSARCSTCCSAMTKAKIEVQQDPARLRPSDVPILLGDDSKFVQGDRLGADDPVRADAARHAGVLARALSAR